MKQPEYIIPLDYSADAAVYVVSRISGEGNDRLAEINSRRYKLESYIESMRTRPNLLEEWDAGLWVTMLDHCVVHRDKTVTFVFRDGKEITE